MPSRMMTRFCLGVCSSAPAATGIGARAGLSRQLTAMYATSRVIISNAGMTAATNILPTELCVVAANMIMGMLGGIRIPRLPPAMMTPSASRRSYPWSSIGLSARLPEVMMPAPMMPTMAPIIELTPTTLIASAPRTRPIASWQRRNMASPMPERVSI